MGRIEVTCKLKDYSDPPQQQIRVHNHWNDNGLVVLEVYGKRYTVSADELRRAIENCTNVGF